MLRWYEDKMPREISKGKRDVGTLQLRWMVEKKVEENQGMLKEEVMRDGVKKGDFRQGNRPSERLDFGKHVGKTFREVYLGDPEYCGWTMRQERLSAPKLRQFKYFLERMEDLTTKNLGICGKADEVERQLRDRILQVCCEEQMGKLARQETRAMEERRTERLEMQECKVKMEKRDGGLIGRTWMWDEPVDDMTCVNLGGSVWIDYPQRRAKKGAMAARRARGATGGGADKKEIMGFGKAGEKTEDDEAEHRELQGNGGDGQGGEEKEEGTDMDEREETVDDKTLEGSEILEMRGDFRHLYGLESCTRCQRNPF